MNIHIRKKWCVLFVLSLLGVRCKKEPIKDELPPLTFVGANTIGCKINGLPWVPKGIFSGGVAIYPVSGGYYGFPYYPGTHIRIRTSDPEIRLNYF